MNAWLEFINTALFQNVSTPCYVFAAICAAVIIGTIALALYELKHDIS